DWLALGNVARNRGDFAAAQKAYAGAVALEGDDARALGALADADARLGKNGDARPLYERGLDAKAALAEARKYHDELVRDDPKDEEARREWAEALAAHGQPGEGAAEWRTLAAGLSRDPARQGQAWLRAG